MNNTLLSDYIHKYKSIFKDISKKELYKWRAIKQFQDHFDLNSTDFFETLKLSLKMTNNLLDSKNYYPKRMILNNALQSPEEVRSLFKELYNEEDDIKLRVENFKKNFKKLNDKNFEGFNDYQDHRSINVYLTLKYPERYFLYKFNMFKEFAERIEYDVKISKGQVKNLTSYIELCNIVQVAINNDSSLIKLNKSRLFNDCYQDSSCTVLTQDFIFAVTKYMGGATNGPSKPSKPKTPEVELIKSSEASIIIPKIDFSGKHIHHYHNDQSNKALGRLGELWVLKFEIEYLRSKGLGKLAAKVTHSSNDEGDGLGYDIRSFDDSGTIKYIEVKTTTGPKNSILYITRNELERSKIEKDKYFLYRVYDFDEKNNNAKLLIIQGSLTNICEVPVSFQVEIA